MFLDDFVLVLLYKFLRPPHLSKTFGTWFTIITSCHVIDGDHPTLVKYLVLDLLLLDLVFTTLAVFTFQLDDFIYIVDRTNSSVLIVSSLNQDYQEKNIYCDFS